MPTEKPKPERPDANLSLTRAIDLLEVVAAEGRVSLPRLVALLELPRSTVHRLATALVERGLLETSPRAGYSIGQGLRALAGATPERKAR
ncbi:MAG: hypothetical protein V7647_661 [Acidobacteriota bacterium]